MKQIRLLTLLALLLTAATGAWAQEQSESFTTATDGQFTYMGEHFTISGQLADGDGLWIGNSGGGDKTVTIESKNGENITKIEAVLGYEQHWGDTKLATTSGEVTGTYNVGQTITISSVNATTVTLSGPEGEFKLIQFYSWTIYYGDAPSSGYTVSMKDGVKDADKWTVKVGEGQAQALPIGGLKGDGSETVTLQYNGRLKVKGVKATSDAAPAAVPVESITLNKTETSIKVGATETLSVTSVLPEEATDKTYTWKTSDVSKATVDQDGKVTAVAAGTVTIYAEANDGSGVKGNCSVTVTPATITVTWNNDDITGSGDSFTKNGVTISAGYIDFDEKNFMMGGTFTTTLGNFTKIEVTSGSVGMLSGTGWSRSMQSATWTGTPASSVSFSNDIMGMGMGNTKFVFTIVPTN